MTPDRRATTGESGDGSATATADAADGPATASADRVLEVLRATVAGVAGLLGIVAWQLLLGGLLLGVVLERTPTTTRGLASVANGLGTVTVGLAVVYGAGRTVSYLDVEVPDRRDAGWAVLGVLALLSVQYGVELLYGFLDVPTSSHGLADAAAANPEILFVLIPASLLFVGPGEELLYRNVIQKNLYDAFSARGAVLVTSVVFALVHLPAFADAAAPAVAASLLLVFVLSLLLGGLYVRTENLVVCAFVHGTFNAVQFAVLYANVAAAGGAIPPS